MATLRCQSLQKVSKAPVENQRCTQTPRFRRSHKERTPPTGRVWKFAPLNTHTHPHLRVRMYFLLVLTETPPPTTTLSWWGWSVGGIKSFLILSSGRWVCFSLVDFDQCMCSLSSLYMRECVLVRYTLFSFALGGVMGGWPAEAFKESRFQWVVRFGVSIIRMEGNYSRGTQDQSFTCLFFAAKPCGGRAKPKQNGCVELFLWLSCTSCSPLHLRGISVCCAKSTKQACAATWRMERSVRTHYITHESLV